MARNIAIFFKADPKGQLPNPRAIYLHKFLVLMLYNFFSYKTLTLINFIIAYFLNLRFQYMHRIGSDPKLLQTVQDVFAKLDLIAQSLSQFGNEVN